jgi:hypothetical protein
MRRGRTRISQTFWFGRFRFGASAPANGRGQVRGYAGARTGRHSSTGVSFPLGSTGQRRGRARGSAMSQPTVAAAIRVALANRRARRG